MRTPVCFPLLAILSTFGGSTASADAQDLELRDLPIAVGVNSPYSWLKEGDKGIGVSFYVGLSRHLALRGNYARYAEDGPTLGIIGEIMGGDAATYDGTIADWGASLVYYPRALWSGPTLELGALRRKRDTSVRGEDERVATNTTGYGARGMVGWSWRFAEVMYVGIAMGLSVGRERGFEDRTPDLATMSTRSDVRGTKVETEGYLRFGFAFGRAR
ncbi:MAG: hypothetical protein KF773_13720 [Deltaproteobacteria bacterium]|nr:hypothetical protein [Deltaproteobacteria bacterium]